jgi:polysaccharide export outer membrane protein
MYLAAAALSVAFGAGVGFAADTNPPHDRARAASAPPAELVQPLPVDASGEPPLTGPTPTEPDVAPLQESEPEPGPNSSYMQSPTQDASLTLRILAAAPTAAPTAAAASFGAAYRLGTGDKVRVTVYGEADLSGEFVVDGSGFVRLPLVGQVLAAGRSVHEFEGDVAAKLSEGYLRSPRVSAEVVGYRPFFILGEVNKPGEYPYVNGMNVVTAVALAGGFTYRADEDDVYIRRNGQAEVQYSADEKTPVMPGDIIRVTERFF